MHTLYGVINKEGELVETIITSRNPQEIAPDEPEWLDCVILPSSEWTPEQIVTYGQWIRTIGHRFAKLTNDEETGSYTAFCSCGQSWVSLPREAEPDIETRKSSVWLCVAGHVFQMEIVGKPDQNHA